MPIVGIGAQPEAIVTGEFQGRNTEAIQKNFEVIFRRLKLLSDAIDGIDGDDGSGGAADPHDILSATHSDSTPASVVNGDLIVGQGGAWARKAVGTNDQFLKVVAGAPEWTEDASGLDLPHDLLGLQHVDTVPDAPVLGDIIEAVGVLEVDLGAFLDGAPSPETIDDLDDGLGFFLSGAPAEPLFEELTVKWTRKEIGAAGAVLTSTGTGTTWSLDSIGRGATVKAYRSTNYVESDATPTAVPFEAVSYDVEGYWDAGAPTRLTVPAGLAGPHVVVGSANFSGALVGVAFLAIYVNGSLVDRTVTAVGNLLAADNVATIASVLDLAAGDYVEFVLEHKLNAPGAHTIVGGVNATNFRMVKV
jgi:hypothetical protein